MGIFHGKNFSRGSSRFLPRDQGLEMLVDDKGYRGALVIWSDDVQTAGEWISLLAQPILSRKIFDLCELFLIVGDDGVTKGQRLCSN